MGDVTGTVCVANGGGGRFGAGGELLVFVFSGIELIDEADWEAECPLVKTLEVRFPDGGGGRGAGL